VAAPLAPARRNIHSGCGFTTRRRNTTYDFRRRLHSATATAAGSADDVSLGVRHTNPCPEFCASSSSLSPQASKFPTPPISSLKKTSMPQRRLLMTYFDHGGQPNHICLPNICQKMFLLLIEYHRAKLNTLLAAILIPVVAVFKPSRFLHFCYGSNIACALPYVCRIAECCRDGAAVPSCQLSMPSITTAIGAEQVRRLLAELDRHTAIGAPRLCDRCVC